MTDRSIHIYCTDREGLRYNISVNCDYRYNYTNSRTVVYVLGAHPNQHVTT